MDSRFRGNDNQTKYFHIALAAFPLPAKTRYLVVPPFGVGLVAGVWLTGGVRLIDGVRLMNGVRLAEGVLFVVVVAAATADGTTTLSPSLSPWITSVLRVSFGPT